MKTVGLIGGMSWESTAIYYRLINSAVKEALGGLHSAKLILYSVDFAEIAALQKQGAWDEAAQAMIRAGMALKCAGADALVICTNTMHKMAAEVEAATQLPLLHIADCTAQAVKRRNMHTVGFLGTQFSMEQPFLHERLEASGLKIIIPDSQDRQIVHRIIFDELCKGIITTRARTEYEGVMTRLIAQGATGIILGCTEITMLFGEEKWNSIELFDTTKIHAEAAVRYALGESAWRAAS